MSVLLECQIDYEDLMHEFLLAHLESAYSLIWGAHEIWGKGGDTLTLWWLVGLFNRAVIGGNLVFGMGDGELTNQHPAWEILWEILQEMLWEMLWEMAWAMMPFF